MSPQDEREVADLADMLDAPLTWEYFAEWIATLLGCSCHGEHACDGCRGLALHAARFVRERKNGPDAGADLLALRPEGGEPSEGAIEAAARAYVEEGRLAMGWLSWLQTSSENRDGECRRIREALRAAYQVDAVRVPPVPSGETRT